MARLIPSYLWQAPFWVQYDHLRTYIMRNNAKYCQDIQTRKLVLGLGEGRQGRGRGVMYNNCIYVDTPPEPNHDHLHLFLFHSSGWMRRWWMHIRPQEWTLIFSSLSTSLWSTSTFSSTHQLSTNGLPVDSSARSLMMAVAEQYNIP